MTAFDTDVLSEILIGTTAYVQRAKLIPDADEAIPVVALEEVFRGRLDGIRKAQAGRIKLTLDRAYDLFRDAVTETRPYQLLPYTPAADALVRQWLSAKIRVGTNDLRIAAIGIAHGNARDYAQVPGLTFAVWN